MSVEIRPAPDVAAPPSTLRVLIAEDDVEVRSTLSEQLASLGHSIVAEVATMREAIEGARDMAPDVVLLDAHLGPSMLTDAAVTIASDHPEVAVVFLCGDSSFTLDDGAAERTTAIAVVPTNTPPRVLDSTIRLAVWRARQLRSARAEVAEAKRQLENRKAIERAKGILMRRTGLSEQEAYRILQRTSQDRSVPMADVAREVLESEPAR